MINTTNSTINAPPSTMAGCAQPTRSGVSAESDNSVISFTNANTAAMTDEATATDALAKLTLKDHGGKKMSLRVKPTAFSLDEDNPNGLKFLNLGIKEADDGSGTKVPHMMAIYYPHSLEDVDHLSLRLYYTNSKNPGDGSTVFEFQRPSVSSAWLNDSDKLLADIASQQLKAINARDPKKKERGSAIRADFHNQHTVMNDEIRKGFPSGTAGPRMKTTLMSTPCSHRCYNAFWQSEAQGQPVTDPTFLLMRPCLAEYEEEKNELNQKFKGNRNYVYWLIPYFGETFGKVNKSPVRAARTTSAQDAADFLAEEGI